MKNHDLSRRAFFTRTGALVGGGWLAAMLPEVLSAAEYVAESGRPFAFKVLTAAEVLDVEAIASQIIPSDETSGAKEARAVEFIDRALETFMSTALPGVQGGLQELNTAVQARHPEVSVFSDLDSAAQIAILKENESTPFFGLIRFLTIAGAFSSPAYGGNQGKVGWKLLGFDDRHVWQPPFGAYEEEAGR